MSPQARSSTDHHHGARTSLEVRSTLLALAREFVRSARRVVGVERIALVGSIVTETAYPKDVDLLVRIGDRIHIDALARLGRRLKGTAQSRLNSGADIFLASSAGEYLGRVCHYRECHRRVLCRARHCGAWPHVADDFDVVRLDNSLIAAPPVELYPTVMAHVPIPVDVEFLLLAPLERDAQPASEHPALPLAVVHRRADPADLARLIPECGGPV